jgi:hypothetical protein
LKKNKHSNNSSREIDTKGRTARSVDVHLLDKKDSVIKIYIYILKILMLTFNKNKTIFLLATTPNPPPTPIASAFPSDILVSMRHML